MAAVEAGEAAIDNQDILKQGAKRQDPWALPYQTDDLSQIVPVIDHRPPVPESHVDPKQRLKTDDEIALELSDFLEELPEDSDPLDVRRFMDTMRLTVGKEEAERDPFTYEAPEIPNDIPALRAGMKDAGETEEISEQMRRLMRQTGLDLRTIRSFKTKELVRHRVVNQTKMGKIARIYTLTIAGDGKGMLGIGEGKSAEIAESQRQALHNAIRMMKPIPRYEQRTIFGQVKLKMGAVELQLMARPPGQSTFSCFGK